MDFMDFFGGHRVMLGQRGGRHDPAMMFYGPRVRLAALAIPERRRRRRPPHIIYDDYDSDSE